MGGTRGSQGSQRSDLGPIRIGEGKQEKEECFIYFVWGGETHCLLEC